MGRTEAKRQYREINKDTDAGGGKEKSRQAEDPQIQRGGDRFSMC